MRDMAPDETLFSFIVLWNSLEAPCLLRTKVSQLFVCLVFFFQQKSFDIFLISP